jgi:hypothetical protein
MGSIPILQAYHVFDSHFQTFLQLQTHFKVTITTLRVRFPPFKDKQKGKQ